MPLWLTIFLWLAAGAWAGLAVVSLISLRLVPSLRAGGAPKGPPRRVAVIVAARDEEDRVETTVRRLLAQTGVALQVVAVDDRSRDATGQLLEKVAREDPRLAVVRVRELPPGWLGKCHALHRGAARIDAEWILFTDADIWMTSGVLARAVAAAEETQADHLCLIPGFASSSFLGRAAILAFSLSLLKIAARVNRDARLLNPGVGIGAFNLVRADVYRRAGGHEALRMQVVDDLKLGALVRDAGGRSRVFFAPADVEAEWGATPRALIKVLEKNQFAVLNFNTPVAGACLAAFFALWFAGALGWAALTPAGLAATLAWLSLVIPCALVARRHGWSPAPALLSPVMLGLMGVSLLNSAARTLAAGGIRWRDTFYPLSDLRRAAVRTSESRPAPP